MSNAIWVLVRTRRIRTRSPKAWRRCSTSVTRKAPCCKAAACPSRAVGRVGIGDELGADEAGVLEVHDCEALVVEQPEVVAGQLQFPCAILWQDKALCGATASSKRR